MMKRIKNLSTDYNKQDWVVMAWLPITNRPLDFKSILLNKVLKNTENQIWDI